jgi:hypothetical protein
LLSPGVVVETEGTHSGGFIGSDFAKAALAQTPLGRIGRPGDIASIALFLASQDSAWLAGKRLLVNLQATVAIIVPLMLLTMYYYENSELSEIAIGNGLGRMAQVKASLKASLGYFIAP